MNRIAQALAAAVLSIGIAVVGLPLNDTGSVTAIGSSGCCKQ